jgi:two-component system response regulator HydG
MRRAFDLAMHAARSTAPVLLTGEVGTGKKHVAHEIHARGETSAGPFVSIRCASLDESSLDGELFGDPTRPDKSALERARGGTLLLDDVGALSAALQLKLLTTLQRGTNARVVASWSLRRGDEHRAEFRPALRRHLAATEIHLPPLRQRREDILPLARAFLARGMGVDHPSRFALSPAAASALEGYAWPENVRQLESAIERAKDLVAEGELTLEAFPDYVRSEPVLDLASLSYREMLVATRDRSTREYLARVLANLDGNVARAAAHAGIERESMYRLLKRYGLDANTFRSD